MMPGSLIEDKINHKYLWKKCPYKHYDANVFEITAYINTKMQINEHE